MYELRFELSGTETATCGDMTVTTAKGAICRLARDMIEAGHYGGATVTVWRGETQCFQPMQLIDWAHWTYREGDQSVRRVKYVPMPAALHDGVRRDV